MQQQRPADDSTPQQAQSAAYPHGRGYGHDYMRGGEVLGGYGYSERDGYERRRGDEGDADGGERRRADDATT